MPSGIHLTQRDRELIWYHRVQLRRSPEDIFREVFYQTRISLPYLRQLCRIVDTGIFDDDFLLPRPVRSGGPRHLMSVNDQGAYIDLFLQNPETTRQQARIQLGHEYYGQEYGIPSSSTLSRVLHDNRITLKILQRIHHLQNGERRAAYMEAIGSYPDYVLCDIDETLSTAKEFLQRRGYAPRGNPAFKTQFEINGKHYSAVVAYTPYGVIARNNCFIPGVSPRTFFQRLARDLRVSFERGAGG